MFVLGHLLGDLKNLEQIQKYEQARYKEIAPKRKVMRLTFPEVQKLAISHPYFYEEEVKAKHREKEAKYYLLVEEDLLEPSMEEETGTSERIQIWRDSQKSTYEHGRG
ncbi:MAG: hypothetical protein HeimC3_32130 [Candidatus Heimdallarchaeota archaeon LC_3]|nr:MAG: hypothetical protein HeimC3_32130 [Candidatus Heimdallarchaeota archaeon LC_3]